MIYEFNILAIIYDSLIKIFNFINKLKIIIKTKLLIANINSIIG